MQEQSLDLELAEDLEKARSSLNKLVSRLGYEIVDISGFLEAVHETARDQLSTLEHAQSGLNAMNKSNEAVVSAATQVSTSSHSPSEAVEGSNNTMRAST